MKNKKCGGLCKLITILSIIIGVLALIGAVLAHWDDLRKIFKWLPDLGCSGEKFEDDEYNDFADL